MARSRISGVALALSLAIGAGVLGGPAAADLDAAAKGVSTMGIFTDNAGQACIAGSRVLVQRSVLDDLISRIRGVVERDVRLGDPLDGSSTMGPLVSQEQFERVTGYIELARREGAGLEEAGCFVEHGLVPGALEVERGRVGQPEQIIGASRSGAATGRRVTLGSTWNNIGAPVVSYFTTAQLAALPAGLEAQPVMLDSRDRGFEPLLRFAGVRRRTETTMVLRRDA